MLWYWNSGMLWKVFWLEKRMSMTFSFLDLFFVQIILQCKLLQKCFSFPENADQHQLLEFTKEKKPDKPNVIGILLWVSSNFFLHLFSKSITETSQNNLTSIRITQLKETKGKYFNMVNPMLLLESLRSLVWHNSW